MRPLVLTNDLILLNAIEALLTSAGIGHVVLDQHMSALEGSIGLLPRRLLVEEERYRAARALLSEAGFGHALAVE
ncbi:DUF2007 domain-containing protein [Ancylobacter gelatini]|uniref:putative signal transducing protein n=1 Tax=Ancylobacter TaxID=99 RepID=UPI001F4E9BD4|nr:DUF2007 domain-containing protein [Ancylobacter gelatini]MCJ8143575.1 DUF2007 domain-containing protein [Ancylobacter gelatini]